MIKWEYDYLLVTRNTHILRCLIYPSIKEYFSDTEKQPQWVPFNQRGEFGWELVQIMWWDSNPMMGYAAFKRAKND